MSSKLSFDESYELWLREQLSQEKNPRRRDLLQKGLSHSTVMFLRKIWFPVVGNFNDLYPEYEVRDLDNKYRYLDLAYMPGGAKCCIEIQDYSSHARDIEPHRFKDLCMKHSALVLDDWALLPVAYLSIRDDPNVCRKLVLSYIGKFVSLQDKTPASTKLNWAELEAVRYARRILRPFDTRELANHLSLGENRTRVVIRSLLDQKRLIVVSGNQRYRKYRLKFD